MRTAWPVLLLLLLLPLLWVGTMLFTGLALWATDETEPPEGVTEGRSAAPREDDAVLRGRPPRDAQRSGKDAPPPARAEDADPEPGFVHLKLDGPTWTPENDVRALVYLDPDRPTEGGSRSGVPLDGVEGRPGLFELKRDAVRGHQVCVQVRGFLPDHVDGDLLAEHGRVTLILEPAPLTRIRVEGLPQRLQRKVNLSVRAVARDKRPVRLHPGPDQVAAIYRGGPWTIRGPVWERRFETRADVHVSASAPGLAQQPDVLDVGHQGGSFTLRMIPSAVLTIVPNGLPPGSWCNVALTRIGGGRGVFHHGGTDQEPIEGRYGHRIDSDLSPGRYAARLDAQHHEPLRVTFEVHHAGEAIRLEPTFTRTTPLGAVAFQLSLPRGVAPKARHRGDSIHVFMRSRGSTNWLSRWTSEASSREGRLVLSPVPAGAYEFLIWESAEHHVAYLPRVSVEADQTTRLDVPLAKGRSFALRPLHEAGLKAGLVLGHGLELRAPGVGVIPFYLDGYLDHGDIAEAGGYDKAAVGPYPFEQLYAAWHDDEGVRHEVELPVSR